jgi:sugar transferase (PEP-CTERM/EpsH1 system associated)
MPPLHILFISPYIPSPIRVRPYNLIKYLAGQGHLVTLLALVPPGEDTDSLGTLRTWCHQVQVAPLPKWRTLWNALSALPSRTPLQAAYSRSPEMAALIRQTLTANRFDVVHVEHLRGAELSLAIEGRPVVFDSVDSITLLFERVSQAGPTWRSRLMARLDLARTRNYESRLLERYARVLVTSPMDRAALAKISTVQPVGEQLVVLPNGVDLEYFAPMDIPRDPATLVFTGKMSYHANIAAAQDLISQVMPMIWEQLPAAKLVIAGKDPPARLIALATDLRITVTGTVPDLRPYLAQATVSVSPIRYGVGIQNKVLEAMAMATPVITTPQAVTSLQAQAGHDLMVADTAQAVAQAAVALLSDQSLRQKIGQAGRRYVETYHDWRVTAQNLEAVYREVMALNGKNEAMPGLKIVR